MLFQIPNVYTYKKNYLDSNSNKIKILILGNSHSYCGCNPEFIQQNAFNAAYFSQSINFDAEILENYINRADSLKYILLPIDYYSLYNRLEYGSESYRVKYYIMDYGFKFPEFYFSTLNIFNNPLSLNFKRLWWIYYKRNTFDLISDRPCDRLGYFKPVQKFVDLKISGKTAAERHKKNSNDFLGDNFLEFQKIIHFCKKKKVKLILFTPPAYKYYIDAFDKNTFEKVAKIGSSFEKNNSNVVYYNFINDTSFRKEDYFDADHLNENGAKKLTIKLNNIISNTESTNKQTKGY